MIEKTGRDLDAEVAQVVFGHTVIWVDDHRGVGHPYLLASELNGADYVRNYSTDMGEACQVAEWIWKQTGYFSISWHAERNQWQAMIVPGVFAYADEPSEAICRAALELQQHD